MDACMMAPGITMRKVEGATLAVVLSSAVLGGCTSSRTPAPPAPFEPEDPATPAEPIAPLPLQVPAQDSRRVALGERLFFDPILSSDGKISCGTCHVFDRGGADGRAISTVAGREPPLYNTPSIFNLAYDYRFNWPAKFDSLEPQLDAPLLSPRVMRSTWDDVIRKLRADPSYKACFSAIYDEGITARSVRDAVSTYERSLTTPSSRFDRYLRGEHDVLSAAERDGYALFKSYGCISCHQGVNVGGNLVARFGVMKDLAERAPLKDADLGRYNFTKRESDRFVFRVPSLRNVALTAPYFHDGSTATLEEAVIEMAELQLGDSLPGEHVDVIVAFLGSLTGSIPTPGKGSRAAAPGG
jgi:cytochrome c peroxidase